ncbi:MAG: pyridoxal-phosphate dependent enzyme [Gammaproteobacteria bacterium]|nr:MAG: pyridoxal-phosphate dependent enzyme [Gammaproteobacteria bacterium]
MTNDTASIDRAADAASLPSLADVQAAAARIAPHAHRTPVMRCSAIDEMLGASLHFKCENLQKVGAFKFRGACNTLLSLSDKQVENGVATHSSGNHGAAVALAAQIRGTSSVVVMPSNSSAVKQAAVAHYGARIVHCEPNEESRTRTLEAIIEDEGRTLVHPFDDARVIAGQGTAALEFVEQVPDLDVVMAPVGGGGLLGGTATAVAALSPQTRIIGAEPAAADDTYRSFRAGHIIPVGVPDTIADGLRTTVGELTFPIITRHVADIVRVSEEAIVEAMRLTWQRTKLIIEASAAVPLAALLEGALDVRDARVGVIISGGNVDLDALPW